ncbi:MAG TPA: hypothetical protein DCL14_02340 [Ruminococcaceae bacterium]|nr:hypothetical protein [Oscillospiraceae bacterium]
MKIYALVGKSGTGKSYQAVSLCKEKNIESIIDDGLFICRNTVLAGISAKRQATKIAAVRTALFHEDYHMESVRAAIEKAEPQTLLVLGTSDRMVDKIVARLGLHEIDERIYIEDITTEEEREIAARQRNDLGQHVIPAPTFQLKRQFSGYFMSPMKVLKGLSPWKETAEKSVVRPTYSYLGGYEISEKVISDIAACVQKELGSVSDLVKVTIGGEQSAGSQVEKDEGVELHIIADFKYGSDLPGRAEAYQKRVADRIEAMTMFNVSKVDLEVRKLI